jgi:hypothetical protein
MPILSRHPKILIWKMQTRSQNILLYQNEVI